MMSHYRQTCGRDRWVTFMSFLWSFLWSFWWSFWLSFWWSFWWSLWWSFWWSLCWSFWWSFWWSFCRANSGGGKGWNLSCVYIFPGNEREHSHWKAACGRELRSELNGGPHWPGRYHYFPQGILFAVIVCSIYVMFVIHITI